MFKTPIKSKSIITAALICMATSIPSVTWAANETVDSAQSEISQKKHHRMGKKAFKKMARYLDLSDEQIAEIKTIKEQARTNDSALRESTKQFFESVKSLQANPTFDEQSFTATYEQYQENFAQLALSKAKTKHAIHQVLTPEQQTKWEEFKTKRQGKRKGRY